MDGEVGRKRLSEMPRDIRQLVDIGEMRPSFLSRRYKNPEDKRGGFHRRNDTHMMKVTQQDGHIRS